jgi:hypothetical protein
MAARQDKNPDDVAQQICGKPLDKCSREDSNKMIQELRSF